MVYCKLELEFEFGIGNFICFKGLYGVAFCVNDTTVLALDIYLLFIFKNSNT